MYGLIGPESFTDVEAGVLGTASIRVTDATVTALTGTLTAGHLTPVDATAGNATYTLPAASTVPAGGVTAVKKADTGANTVTVQRAGSDVVYGTGAGGASRTVTLPGESVVFTSNGVNAWTVMASDTPVPQLDARYNNTYAEKVTWKASNTTDGNLLGGRSAGNAIVVNVGATQGINNTALGYNAMLTQVTGSYNTAVGYLSMSQGNGAGTGGDHNTALGYVALRQVTTGYRNVGVGTHALDNNTTGFENVAVGDRSMELATNPIENTAIGTYSMNHLLTGRENVGIGYFALYKNTTGNYNTAVGIGSLTETLDVNENVGVGYYAGGANTTGTGSVFVGSSAGNKPNNVTANATTTGVRQTCIGYQTGQGSTAQRTDIVAIGWRAVVDGNGAIAIGASTSAGAAGAVAIGQDHNGTAATTTTQDAFVLGTTAHQVQIRNNTTGAGSAALGANSPATTNTAPYTWFKMLSNDGSTVYVPAWK